MPLPPRAAQEPRFPLTVVSCSPLLIWSEPYGTAWSVIIGVTCTQIAVAKLEDDTVFIGPTGGGESDLT